MTNRKIDKKSLSKILDEQYKHCKNHIILDMQDKIDKLSEYRGDIVDIKTEIIIGHSMEETLFQQGYSDYYNKSDIMVIIKNE